MITIIDCWLQDGKTAIYCAGDRIRELPSRKKVCIRKETFDVLGYDILTALTGETNVMLLLDTQKQFIVPVEID